MAFIQKKRMILDKRAEGLRPFTISIVSIILVAFFLLMFVTQFLSTTNPDAEILDSENKLGERINTLNDSLSDFSDLSTDIQSRLVDSEPSATDYLYLMFKGAFYIPIAFMSVLAGGINVITGVLFPSLGGTGLGNILSIILGVITSVFVITAVLLILKAIRLGESER